MPWYSAGTVTVTNGSITVTGAGTQFSANVRVGDAFRGPDGGWYEVSNIASATVLSINPPYESANAAGAAYRIAPLQGYVKESADRLRMIVEQWGQALSDLGTLQPWATATDADAALAELGASEFGTQLIAAVGADAALLLLNASAAGVAVLRAANATAQRAVLELGSAAVRDVVTSTTEYDTSKVVNCGYVGLGSVGAVLLTAQSDFTQCGFGRATNGSFGAYPSFVQTGDSATHQTQIGGRTLDADDLQFVKKTAGVWRTARVFRHSGNTSVDSNGFLKNASPIVKLFSDHIDANEEAKDVTLEKQAVGVYQLHTERRFAEEGWYIETPKDANGNIKVFIRYEENDQGILIQTFEPDYSTGRVVAAAPVDIPDGRWIDVRLTYTQAEIDQKAAELADYEARLAAKNVIESTENNPQEAEPDE